MYPLPPDNFIATATPDTVHDAAAQRRFGKFMYTVELINSGVEVLRKVYERVIPVDIQYEFARQVFTVTAISDEFDTLEQGDVVPFYVVKVKTVIRKNGKKAYYLTFHRED